jgi:uncharacterized membrane protein YjfL (UPF0719 family)
MLAAPFEEGLGSALGDGTIAIVSYAALGLVLFVVGFYVVDLTTPGRLISVIRSERNPNAALLAICGMVAIGLIVAASIFASGGKLADGLVATAVFGAVGIAAQTIAMLVFDKLIGVDVKACLTEAKIEPAAILLGVTHIMIGLVTAIAVI